MKFRILGIPVIIGAPVLGGDAEKLNRYEEEDLENKAFENFGSVRWNEENQAAYDEYLDLQDDLTERGII